MPASDLKVIVKTDGRNIEKLRRFVVVLNHTPLPVKAKEWLLDRACERWPYYVRADWPDGKKFIDWQPVTVDWRKLNALRRTEKANKAD